MEKEIRDVSLVEQLPLDNSSTSSLEENNLVQPLNKAQVPETTAKNVWGPSGYTGNKIRRNSSKRTDKSMLSSSGSVSSRDNSTEKPSQMCGGISASVQVSMRSICLLVTHWDLLVYLLQY